MVGLNDAGASNGQVRIIDIRHCWGNGGGGSVIIGLNLLWRAAIASLI